MQITPDTALLVDSSIYIFRSWFSNDPEDFTDHEGQPTNAVYGYTGFLCTLLEQTRAKEIGLAFDESLTTSFRNEIFPEYKANRDPAPIELKRQFAWCKEIASALGLAIFADSRYEADDLIGSLAKHHREEGKHLCVVTADKDLTQLIYGEDIWWDFSRRNKLDRNGIKDKFGVYPEQIADFLAITGDKVDNIPGVPGVGPKGASALLTHFGNLESLYSRVDEIAFLSIRGAKSIHTKLKANQELVELSRRLTGIYEHAESVVEAPQIIRGEINQDALNEAFDKLNFGPMLRRRCLNL